MSTHPEIQIQDQPNDSLPFGSRQFVSHDLISSTKANEDEGSRILIAPSMTTLEEAWKISSEGTSQGAGNILSVSKTPTEVVKQNLTTQLSEQNLSALSEHLQNILVRTLPKPKVHLQLLFQQYVWNNLKP